MKYFVYHSKKFKKSLDKLKLSDEFKVKNLKEVITFLADGHKLPSKYKDHKLKGKLNGLRECHIRPDTLLLYQKDEKEKLIILLDIGSHSDFFD